VYTRFESTPCHFIIESSHPSPCYLVEVCATSHHDHVHIQQAALRHLVHNHARHERVDPRGTILHANLQFNIIGFLVHLVECLRNFYLCSNIPPLLQVSCDMTRTFASH
jgi:hypothetical protein